MIREPESAIDRSVDENSTPAESPVLSVETLQMLTESTSTMRILFDSLWDQKKLEMWQGETPDREVVFRGFQHSLSTEVRRQQTRRSGTSVELLPILVLRARAADPNDAQLIANAWAKIVESKSKELYTQGVAAVDDFIGDMYKQSNESLARLEDDLSKKTLEANVALKTAQRETLSLKISELEGKILDLDIEIAVNAIEIQEGRRRILEQEYAGEWIGTVAESSSIQNETYPFPTDTLSDRAKRVLALVSQKVAQTTALREYRLEQNLLGKEAKLAHYQLDIVRILTDKAKAEDELPSMEDALAALQKEIEGLPETLVLDKAITDDALWDAAINNPDSKIGDLGSLKSEMVNPVYLSTREMMISTTSKIETIRSSVSQLTKTAENVTAQIELLDAEIGAIKQEVSRRESALKDTEANLALLREDYLAMIKRVEEFESNNLRKIEEKKTREERLAAFEAEATNLESELALAQLNLDALTREVEKTRNVRAAIAAKAETAALLQVTAENASRTGTTILYNAEADPNSLAIGGSKIVLGTTLMAVALACVAIAGVAVLRPRS
jgi:predicted  nucleic acid-binding Zn-ribbon protein